MTRTAVFVGLRLASPFIRLPPPPLFFTFSTSTPFFLRLYFSTRTKIWRGAAEEEPPKNNPKTKIKGNTTRIETPFPFDSFFCETFCCFFLFVCFFYVGAPSAAGRVPFFFCFGGVLIYRRPFPSRVLVFDRTVFVFRRLYRRRRRRFLSRISHLESVSDASDGRPMLGPLAVALVRR